MSLYKLTVKRRKLSISFAIVGLLRNWILLGVVVALGAVFVLSLVSPARAGKVHAETSVSKNNIRRSHCSNTESDARKLSGFSFYAECYSSFDNSWASAKEGWLFTGGKYVLDNFATSSRQSHRYSVSAHAHHHINSPTPGGVVDQPQPEVPPPGSPGTTTFTHINYEPAGPNQLSIDLVPETFLQISLAGLTTGESDSTALRMEVDGFVSEVVLSGTARLQNAIQATKLEVSASAPLGIQVTKTGVFDSVPFEIQQFPNQIYALRFTAPLHFTVNATLDSDLDIEVGDVSESSCTPPPSGIVDWWPFDETGTSKAQDIRGSVNNLGTHMNGPSPGLGVVDGAVCFDGLNDYIEVADNTEINFPSDCASGVDGSFTIDAWVKSNVTSGVHTILDKRVNLSQPRGYSLFLSDGRLGFQMADGSAPGIACGTGTSFPCTNYVAPGPPSLQFINVASNEWHFIAVTVTKCPTPEGQMYVDGDLVLSFTPRTGNIVSSAAMQIGRRHPEFHDTYFNGCIDELEFFNRALSEGEIGAIFQADHAGKCFRQPCPTISITPETLVHQTWQANVDYPAFSVAATGGTGPYAFTVTNGNLPPGMVVDPDGTLHGRPVTPGTYGFTVTAEDANGCFNERRYDIVIVNCSSITINPATLVHQKWGVNVEYPPLKLTATGGTGSYTFAVSSNVPPGMGVDSDGTVNGTPVTPGTYSFTVTVEDANGCVGEREYRIIITCCPTITLNPSAGALPASVVNNPYSQTITATGGCTSSFTFSVTSGALPLGLTVSANGVLSGTAAQAGDFSFNVTANDSCGCSKTQNYTLKVQSAQNLVRTKTLVISAFRENGPNGARDEFIEIFNPSHLPVTVSSLSGDPSGPETGIGVFSSSGNVNGSKNVTLRCQIPGSTVIKGRGWYLCGGSQYSLSNLGGNGSAFHSIPDATISGDIPNDAGLTLLNIGSDIVTACPITSAGGNCPTGFTISGGNVSVLDKVGFGPYGLTAPGAKAYPSLAANYCESNCLQPVGDASTVNPTPLCPMAVGPTSDPAAFPVLSDSNGTFLVCYGESGQYQISRRRSIQQFDSSAGNLYRDTDNNTDDFVMNAPNPSTGNVGEAVTGVQGVSSVLGAAGPHNRSAPPLIGPVIHSQDAFDMCTSAILPCTPGALMPRNAERRYGQVGIANPENAPAGTFILRRRFINALGSTTGARYRIDDISTLCGGQVGVHGAGSAVATQEARNLRVTGPTCQGEGSDMSIFTAVLKAVNHGQEFVIDSGGVVRTVFGSVLEDTSVDGGSRHQPFGGGSNSSFVATTATVPTGDGVNGGTGLFQTMAGPQGSVFRIAFRFGVVKSGRFKLLFGTEVNSSVPPAP